MKRALPWIAEISAIAVICFILAHMFVMGLERELEIREARDRAWMEGKQ